MTITYTVQMMFLFNHAMKGIGNHLNLIEIGKKFSPIILIVIVGMIVLLWLRDDGMHDDSPLTDDIFTENSLSSESGALSHPDTDNHTEETVTETIVDIKGEIKHPGVYEVQATDRIQTVIELAGGFTKNADENQINLAQKVQDEMVIYVPKEGETEYPINPNQMISTNAGNNEENENVVKVNLATIDELTKLQGIGPAKAQAILDYREEHGPFQQVEDLLQVSGIGEKTLENI